MKNLFFFNFDQNKYRDVNFREKTIPHTYRYLCRYPNITTCHFRQDFIFCRQTSLFLNLVLTELQRIITYGIDSGDYSELMHIFSIVTDDGKMRYGNLKVH